MAAHDDASAKDITQTESRTRRRMAAGAVLAAVLVGGAFLGIAQKQDFLRNAPGTELAQPVARLMQFFGRSEEPLPPDILHPPTSPGTLSGPWILAESEKPGMLLPDGSFRQEGQSVLPAVQEDARVPREFVEDLTAYLVAHYVPGRKNDSGVLNLTIQDLNRHCGNRFSLEPNGGRNAILQYAFHPVMLRALYRFYVPSFLESLQLRARGTFPPEGVSTFFTVLGERADLLGRSMNLILLHQDIFKDIGAFEKKADECESIDDTMILAQYDLEQLEEDQDPHVDAERAQLQKRIDELRQRYRKALDDRDALLRNISRSLREQDSSDLDTDSLLFLAFWMHRRMLQDETAEESLEACIEILEDLGLRLRDLPDLPLGNDPGASSVIGRPGTGGADGTGSEHPSENALSEPQPSGLLSGTPEESPAQLSPGERSGRPVPQNPREVNGRTDTGTTGKADHADAVPPRDAEIRTTHEIPMVREIRAHVGESVDDSVPEKDAARDASRDTSRGRAGSPDDVRGASLVRNQDLLPGKRAGGQRTGAAREMSGRPGADPAGTAEKPVREERTAPVRLPEETAAALPAEEKSVPQKEAPVGEHADPAADGSRERREEDASSGLSDGLPQPIQVPIRF